MLPGGKRPRLGEAKMIEMDGENYLDKEEASRLLGVKTSTLYAYVSRGLLKSYKQGIKRQRLYKQAELEALLRLRPSDTSPSAAGDAPGRGLGAIYLKVSRTRSVTCREILGPPGTRPGSLQSIAASA